MDHTGSETAMNKKNSHKLDPVLPCSAPEGTKSRGHGAYGERRLLRQRIWGFLVGDMHIYIYSIYIYMDL
jgi:hypothetical protein